MEQIVEKYINPLTDFGFKRIFGTEFNKDLLISFLNALFEGKEDIEQLYDICVATTVFHYDYPPILRSQGKDCFFD